MREWNLLAGERGVYRLSAERNLLSKPVSLWLLEAVIASQGQFNGAISGIGNLPCLYPFAVDVGLRDLRRCEHLEVHSVDAHVASILAKQD